MHSSFLIKESIKRLRTQDPYDIVLYLDERGTPAQDRRFITGGVLVYSNVDRVSADWRHFSQSLNLWKRKGASLSRKELLEVANFVVGQPLLPVAVWSALCAEELERLHAHAEEYERSKSPEKRFKKIAASSYLWKHQITQTMAYAHASFLDFLGPVRQAAVYVDQMTDPPGMPEHYQALVEENSSWEHMRSVVVGAGAPQALIKLLERVNPTQWQVNLNAKGPLAQLADFICAMFGKCMDDEIREPWEIVRLCYTVGEGQFFPPCMGGDVTWSVRAWLEELYSQGKPEDRGEESNNADK